MALEPALLAAARPLELDSAPSPASGPLREELAALKPWDVALQLQPLLAKWVANQIEVRCLRCVCWPCQAESRLRAHTGAACFVTVGQSAPCLHRSCLTAKQTTCTACIHA